MCGLFSSMKKIRLGGKGGKDKFVLVDDEDFEFVNQWQWFLRHDGYAARTEYLGGGRKNLSNRTIFLHRVLMEAKRGEIIDHKNGDKLDDRRSNLRRCSKQQNNTNHKVYKTCKSGYTGVQWREDRERWT